MMQLPEQLVQRYAVVLEEHGPYFIMWLRYYLDFCDKYAVEGPEPLRLGRFLAELGEKRQPQKRRDQAAHAVSLFSGMLLAPDEAAPPSSMPQQTSELKPCPPVYPGRASQFCEAGYQVSSQSPEWDDVLAKLAGEIKLRHYSRKTLKAYATWTRHFQRFGKNKPPVELTTEDVKEYLTHLAVTCHVAASTQNQAFNSLLFLYRHALKREFGELRGVPRAKKSLYVPTVLFRAEIDAILDQLPTPYRLVVGLLFGCGLRLFEGLQLRIGDFNFDAGFSPCTAKARRIEPSLCRRPCCPRSGRPEKPRGTLWGIQA
ncbi:phage integrase N-terminal SAM-like domain-containing protein [Geomonas subterranea]|uniref:phage integrase N-terminal SAM-like domain-containing protein n=1 Tax=Geomonas subterranea TaxID=2847989 RepID=UPI001CD6C276|nr:phage integrase N-terminal SAM-like domain-containing protein [Geomonas fuzhouensis]